MLLKVDGKTSIEWYYSAMEQHHPSEGFQVVHRVYHPIITFKLRELKIWWQGLPQNFSSERWVSVKPIISCSFRSKLLLQL